jgi:hypothetical protein
MIGLMYVRLWLQLRKSYKHATELIRQGSTLLPFWRSWWSLKLNEKVVEKVKWLHLIKYSKEQIGRSIWMEDNK